MRICFLSALHPALDKRVHYKEAMSLVAAGFDVSHVTPGDEEPRVQDGVRLVFFHGKRSVLGRILQLKRLYQTAAAVDADVYHCNELESWAVGIWLRIRKRKRVIFDVHELYSTNVSERLFPKPFRPAVEALVKIYIRILLRFTDRVVFAKQSVERDFPSSFAEAVVVRNYVQIPENLPATSGELHGNGLTAIHIGEINRARGWPQLLDALSQCNEPLELSVIGRFTDGSEDEFDAEVQRRGLQDRVSRSSWIPYDEVPGRVAASQIGVITFQPVHDNFVHALPHKLFDYMLAGLPVVVPDFAVEVAQIVRESGSGLLVDTTRPDEIARVLDRLALDPALRKEMGERGHRAVFERYNWEAEAVKLVQMYRELNAEITKSRERSMS